MIRTLKKYSVKLTLCFLLYDKTELNLDYLQLKKHKTPDLLLTVEP